jgi:hypothetical protein
MFLLCDALSCKSQRDRSFRSLDGLMLLGRSLLWYYAALVVLILIPLFATLACSGPEEGQWSLLFYRGSNGGVQCPDGVDGLACALKAGGSLEDPSISKAYTRDEFPQPLAACIREGKLPEENPFSPEARRLFGRSSVAPDRVSFSNKPRGHWDMVLCVKGSQEYIFGIVRRYPSGWLQHLEYRFVN